MRKIVLLSTVLPFIVKFAVVTTASNDVIPAPTKGTLLASSHVDPLQTDLFLLADSKFSSPWSNGGKKLRGLGLDVKKYQRTVLDSPEVQRSRQAFYNSYHEETPTKQTSSSSHSKDYASDDKADISKQATFRHRLARSRSILEMFVFTSWVLFAFVCCVACAHLRLVRRREMYRTRDLTSSDYNASSATTTIDNAKAREEALNFLKQRLEGSTMTVSEDMFDKLSDLDTTSDSLSSSGCSEETQDFQSNQLDLENGEAILETSVNTQSNHPEGDSNSIGSLPATLSFPQHLNDPQYLQGNQEEVKTQKNRTIPNSCAICLSSYEVGERVVFSTNPECSHAFHHSCFETWCVQKLQDSIRIKVFVCPFCRQDFVNIKSFSHECDSSKTTQSE